MLFMSGTDGWMYSPDDRTDNQKTELLTSG